MNYVFHGSSIPNLKIIIPKESTHLKKWVYASLSKAIATIFLSKLGNDLYYSLSGNGVNSEIELVERKPLMFKKIFDCDGYIYKLNASNFKSGLTSWSAEVVSDKEETVIDSEYIKCVYDELINLNNSGKIKLYLYPSRPDRIPLDNSDLIPKVIKWQERGFDINKFYELYPELKEKYLDVINNSN